MSATLSTDPTLRIREAFDRDRSQMTLQLARDLGLSELDVIRALPDGLSVELDASRAEELIRSFESLGKVHVLVSNQSTTIECFGEFGNFSTFGDWFNVQSKSLDLHIRHTEVAAVFAVSKPSHMDRVNTISVQFFDRWGNSAIKVFLTFGGSPPSPQRMQQFASIIERFRKTGE